MGIFYRFDGRFCPGPCVHLLTTIVRARSTNWQCGAVPGCCFCAGSHAARLMRDGGKFFDFGGKTREILQRKFQLVIHQHALRITHVIADTPRGGAAWESHDSRCPPQGPPNQFSLAHTCPSQCAHLLPTCRWSGTGTWRKELRTKNVLEIGRGRQRFRSQKIVCVPQHVCKHGVVPETFKRPMVSQTPLKQ